jgi:hypothetical protein
MRAAVLNTFGSSLEATVISRPVCRRGELLIPVRASGINPLDTKIRPGQAALQGLCCRPRSPDGDVRSRDVKRAIDSFSVRWGVFLHLAADALEWCGASRADPLPLEGLRERFLPEATFRGRQNAKLQYAVLAAAAVHGGTEPDLLDEVASWQADDFWQYAMYAAVAYIRAAASRAGVPVHRACQDLDERPGHPAP